MKGSFQLITIIVFITLAVLAVFVFSGAIPLGQKDQPGSLGKVVLWGTVSTETMAALVQDFNETNQSLTLEYVPKSRDTFGQDLLEALASRRGPDMFLLTDDLAYNYADKIFTIPYKSYPLSSYRANFSSAGEVFLTEEGILAFPLSVDPLMMYYNRSMFDANGLIKPPVYWDEVLEVVPILTKRDDSNRILKSAVALGHFSNVTHAKDILATLFMQTGNPIVKEEQGKFISSLDRSNPSGDPVSTLTFYTTFANPSQTVYSWNRSHPNSNEVFSRENLAIYFGFASELKSLVNKNPNQNFAVAPFPQIRSANFKLTDARVTGVALLSSSTNFNTAYVAANLMANGNFAAKFAQAQGIAPARRDLLGQKPEDAYSPIFYDSALYSRSWLDPSPSGTNDIFRQMVEGVLSNTTNASDAIKDASSRLDFLLSK